MSGQSFAQTFRIIGASIYAVSLQEKMKDRQQQAPHFQSLSPYSRFFACLLCGRQVAICLCMPLPLFSIPSSQQQLIKKAISE